MKGKFEFDVLIVWEKLDFGLVYCSQLYSIWYAGKPHTIQFIWTNVELVKGWVAKSQPFCFSICHPHIMLSPGWKVLGGFICISPSWHSVTSSSSQCCWTRMASQIIECYQFRCHFAEPQKRYDQNRSPYQNINWLWNDSWTNHLLMTAELALSL